MRIEADDTVFDAWHLYLAEDGQVPPRVLQEIAELLGRHRRRQDQQKAARRLAYEELVARVCAGYGEVNGLEDALRSCGLAGAAA